MDSKLTVNNASLSKSSNTIDHEIIYLFSLLTAEEKQTMLHSWDRLNKTNN